MTPVLRHITREEISAQLSHTALLSPVRQAMIAYSAGKATSAAQVLFPASGADVHIKSAVLPGAPIFTVKLAGWSERLKADTGNGHSGLILVCDSRTCQPLALLRDGHLISDYRTGAAGALAGHSCLSAGAVDAALLGAGTQARHQVQALAQLREIRSLRIWARRPEAAKSLAAALQAELPASRVSVEGTPSEAMRGAGLVVAATAARAPLFHAEDVKPGQTVISVGGDDEIKCELPPGLLSRADKVFTDSLGQARAYGNAARALSSGLAEAELGMQELGAAWASNDRLRNSERQVIVCSLTGLGVQDLAAVSTLFNWETPRTHSAPAQKTG
ncbi:ornithine cyclodeaminase family protein [Leisingera aquaemixtae]|uniref:ornithine cyclodeaminase family protein n=1 Tax=Leisingera aquaemixtae TaxID=1396826 RepID=UPI001C9620E2|nr:ornithine cyclodeaminase family protein [Leisingera aquaemixtae]MBY6069324.1 ornithine cyclodeaminase family protein [Leisingera aquaemixtae]